MILFIEFICLIVFIRCRPFKKEKKRISVLKYRELNLLTGEIPELTEKEMRKDISVITDTGYEMTLLSELFDIAENKIKHDGKLFLILNSSEQYQPVGF